MTNGLVIFALIGLLTACGGSSASSDGTTGTTSGTPSGTSNTPSQTDDGLKVVSQTGCTVVDTGIGSTFLYSYQSDMLESGDRFVTCEIIGGNAQYSDTHLYKVGSNGANNGSCNVVADVDTASLGSWQFTSLNGVTKVIYNDSSSSHNGYTYTFLAGNCTTF